MASRAYSLILRGIFRTKDAVVRDATAVPPVRAADRECLPPVVAIALGELNLQYEKCLVQARYSNLPWTVL